MQEHKIIEQRLKDRRTELAQRLARINQDVRHARKPLEADFAEQAVERENDEVLDALGESLRGELALIETALSRIERDEYGVCERCGQAIPVSRLEALPYASRCVTCQEGRQTTTNSEG